LTCVFAPRADNHSTRRRCLESLRRHWIYTSVATYAASSPRPVVVLLLPEDMYDVVVPARTRPLFVCNFSPFPNDSFDRTLTSPRSPKVQTVQTCHHIFSSFHTTHTASISKSQVIHNVTSILPPSALGKPRVLVPVRGRARSLRFAVWRVHHQDAEERKLGRV